MANTYIYFTEGIDVIVVYSGNGGTLFFDQADAKDSGGTNKVIETNEIDYPQGKTVSFQAFTKNGYEFTKWVYRVNSVTGSPTEETNNPMSMAINASVSNFYITAYSGGSDSGGEEPELSSWELVTKTISTPIKSEYDVDIDIELKTLYRYKITFQNSGAAEFYTESDIDTLGFLSTSTTLNSNGDAPKSYLNDPGDDDDAGDGSNFYFSYDVEANKTYYVWVKSYAGGSSGYATLYIVPPESQQSSRPSNFSWTSEKVSGGDFNLTADEWNAFTYRVNEFRDYKGLGAYDFTEAEPENIVQAAMYNKAREAIQEIDGYGEYIPYVYPNTEITAYMMNVLVSELNAIP